MRYYHQLQMMQQYQKNYQNKKKTIIIIGIIVGILILIGIGIGLYFAFTMNNTDTDTKTDTFKVNLPVELKNISIPKCTTNTCIKVGEKILLNQNLSSDNYVVTIKNNLIGIQKMKNGFPLYTTYNDFIKMIGSEESSPFYLIIYNSKNKIYTYLYLNNRECKLTNNGLQDGNKIINLSSSQIVLNGNTYFIDYSYDRKNKIILLVDDRGIPYSTITETELDKLIQDNKVKVTQNIINNIGYILLTKYSLLVFNINNKLIGIISTSP